MKVHISTGIGSWTVTKIAKLVACPHVGDCIEVDGVTVMCDNVYISETEVFVREKRNWSHEEFELFKRETGWE